MIDPLKMENEAQARLISRLNEEIRKAIQDLEKARTELGALQHSFNFYKKLQDAIIANESLQPEWNSFLIMLKMVVPESEYWADPNNGMMSNATRYY